MCHKGLENDMKIQGSYRIGTKCTASMKTVTKTMGENDIKIEATFTPHHSGHKLEVGCQILSKNDRNILAAQLQLGVPKEGVLQNICAEFNENNRIRFTTKKDLHNISASYRINCTEAYDQNDAVAVDKLVAMLQADMDHPILFYNTQGELSCNFLQLQKDDFALAIMNSSQMEIFKIYRNSVISIDSTHGTNKYDIQLTSTT